MQQLTGLDAAFLALETANSTGHVGISAMLSVNAVRGHTASPFPQEADGSCRVS